MTTFNPFDEKSWGSDMDNAVVPQRELEDDLRQLVFGKHPHSLEHSFDNPDFGESMRQLRREQENLRSGEDQVENGGRNLLSALRRTPEELSELLIERPQQVMSDREVSDRLHQRDPNWWSEIETARRDYGEFLTGDEKFA